MYSSTSGAPTIDSFNFVNNCNFVSSSIDVVVDDVVDDDIVDFATVNNVGHRACFKKMKNIIRFVQIIAGLSFYHQYQSMQLQQGLLFGIRQLTSWNR